MLHARKGRCGAGYKGVQKPLGWQHPEGVSFSIANKKNIFHKLLGLCLFFYATLIGRARTAVQDVVIAEDRDTYDDLRKLA